MKSCLVKGVRKSLIKKSKKKDKKKSKLLKDSERLPEAAIESQPKNDQTADLSNEGESIDDISNFINEQSGEDEINFQVEQMDEVDNTQPLIPSVFSADEKKKLQRQTVLEVKVDKLEKSLSTFANDLKEVKSLLNIRSKTSKNKGGISAFCKDACVYQLLPKFRLKKVEQAKKMDTDVKNVDYKKELVQKMSLIGGRTVKEFVTNIFKKMFTPKLKTKFTWTGASKTGPKEAFQNFEGIISAMQIAVSAHYDCTIADIENECKLRLKQAQKDYDRLKLKKKREKERLEKEQLEKERLTNMLEEEDED